MLNLLEYKVSFVTKVGKHNMVSLFFDIFSTKCNTSYTKWKVPNEIQNCFRVLNRVLQGGADFLTVIRLVVVCLSFCYEFISRLINAAGKVEGNAISFVDILSQTKVLDKMTF